MKPRFVVRIWHTESSELRCIWGVFDLTLCTLVETCPTRKAARERARELNALNSEWKSDAQGKAAE